jgi:hypothetical protein
VKGALDIIHERSPTYTDEGHTRVKVIQLFEERLLHSGSFFGRIMLPWGFVGI